ncbi:MAG: hypothetical protein K2P59_11770 [Acetatifactor sp.]|nr:hypothetical protein [Acetatifactor sp.]
MGEANAALCVYINRMDRIRSVLEYYLGEKLPKDWVWEEIRGFYPVRDSRGVVESGRRFGEQLAEDQPEKQIWGMLRDSA